MILGRDALVPIINSKNPMLEEICRQGISAEEFAQLFTDNENQNLENLFQVDQKVSFRYYITDNESVKASIISFTKINSDDLKASIMKTAEEVVAAVQKDIYALGFCKLIDVRDPKTNEVLEGIKLIPIDKNNNGRIDHFENIYSSLDAFNRGVWIGKYPNSLCGNIYAISTSKPTDKNALEFLTWINTAGQQFLNANGYSNLVSSERQANLEALAEPQNDQAQNQKPLLSTAWLIVLIAFVISVIILIRVVRYIKNRKLSELDEDIEITPAFDENSILAPKGLYFDKSHTWAFMEPDGNVKIGLDDFMQHVTGLLTRIKMKEPGEKVRKGEKIMTIIQNGKQLDISSPVSGTIIEKNQALAEDSSLINSNPYSTGWVYMIEPKNWLREIQFMFMAEKYREWLQDEFIRLKDFLASYLRSNKTVYAHIILQDGGELTDNVLADFGPEVWEDFQMKFIDTSK